MLYILYTGEILTFPLCLISRQKKLKIPTACGIAHFRSKLTDSDAEQAETQHWLRTAFLCKYITENQFDDKIDECKHIGAMLGKMIIDAKKWCYIL